MSVYVCCEAKREAPAHKSHESALLRQRQVWNKVNFLLICVSEKWHFSVRMFRRCVSVKNGSNMYVSDDGVEELVIICDHVHFSHKNKWTQDCFLTPKGRGWGETMWHWYRKWTDSERSHLPNSLWLNSSVWLGQWKTEMNSRWILFQVYERLTTLDDSITFSTLT